MVDQPFAGHRQPGEIQRLTQCVVHAQLLHHIRQLGLFRFVIKFVHITVAHGDQHAVHEGFACFVVLLSRALGIGDGLLDIRTHDGHSESVDANRRQLRRNTFPCCDGVGDGLGHASVALEFCHERIVMRCRDYAGNEIGDGAADYSGLTKGGKHLVDVMQERRARTNHQHAGTFEHSSMRVEQICGAMQGNGGFAGTRTALHHHGLIEVRTDDTVLFGLDGGHDVGHLAGAFGVQ